jgi:hypothetical protein
MRVRFRVFESSFASWKDLFQEAADFAGTIRPDHLITISHSADHNDGVVCVWFWEDEPEDTAPATQE